MIQKIAKQPQSDEQKIVQLRQDINRIKQLIHQEYKQRLNNISNKIQNIFLLGPSGSGKSTLANELSGIRIVFQSEDDETFDCKPQDNKKMKFKVSEGMISQTFQPQGEMVFQNFQLWDLPGYFDNRCKYMDLKNIVFSQSLIQISEYSQIIIVVPASQFFDSNYDKIIQILNSIDTINSTISLSLLISMVNQTGLDEFKEELEKLLKSNKLQSGKKLLSQIIQENRVILFELPIYEANGNGFYQFDASQIEEIKKQIFKPELFIKHNKIRLNPPDETLMTLQDLYKQYQDIIKLSQETLNDLQIEILIRNVLANNTYECKQKMKENQNKLMIQEQDFHNNVNNYEFFIQQFQSSNIKYEYKFLDDKNKQEQQIKSSFYEFKDAFKSNDYQNIVQQNGVLYIYCIYLSATNLIHILSKVHGIKVIFLCTLVGFKLDKDLELPGIQIHINTYYFTINENQKLQINLKGKDGEDTQPPQAGQNKTNPQEGEEGQIGNDGCDGGSLFIEAQHFIMNEDNLTINVSGGNGGKGQDGGDGRKGQNGADGERINQNNYNQHNIIATKEIEQSVLENYGTFSNTYEILFESKGTPGCIGGNSGQGGQGGNRGKAGIIEINNMKQIKTIAQEGSIGPNGKAGIPGIGGQVGKTFLRILKIVKAFGALREHEKLEQTQGVGQRILVNLASLGICTLASIFGTAVNSIIKEDQWLDEGKYVSEEIYAQNGKIKEQINQRGIYIENQQDIKSKEMEIFVIQAKQKWIGNVLTEQIFNVLKEIK